MEGQFTSDMDENKTSASNSYSNGILICSINFDFTTDYNRNNQTFVYQYRTGGTHGEDHDVFLSGPICGTAKVNKEGTSNKFQRAFLYLNSQNIRGEEFPNKNFLYINTRVSGWTHLDKSLIFSGQKFHWKFDYGF